MSEKWVCPQCMSPSEEERCPQCGAQCEEAGSIRQALPPQTILAGRYLVGRAVGGGGFGITYRAIDLTAGPAEEKFVAIKEYFPRSMARRDGDIQVVPYEDHAQDFAVWRDKIGQEYRMMVHLRSCEAVVHVIEAFMENGTVYIVMDFIEGETLESRVKKNGPIPAKELLAMLKQLLPELIRMHAANVLHRDINPANIMLPPGKCPKLIDFGSARPNPRSGNTALTAIVRRGYAPLEQHVRNGRQGTWSDVYGLCACLYFALSGVEPADAQTRQAMDVLRPLPLLCPEAPIVLTEAIMQGLQMEIPMRVPDFETLWSMIEPLMPEEFDDGLVDDDFPAVVSRTVRLREDVVHSDEGTQAEELPVTQLYKPEEQPVPDLRAQLAALEKRVQAVEKAAGLLKLVKPAMARRILLEIEALKMKLHDPAAGERLDTIVREGGKIFTAAVEILSRK